ncbi:hypothetical protein [Vibrio sp. D431a]|uniref:hypothetical protein n=1 Tax=Vibrio sp. D431a TaxID=2837388 RepID=UPI002553CB22|nr:hypothetical protein [Vibrio sp. D431a]MDK9793234.1 hypothetical protein [Vibrio sp. D431a]
MRKFAKCVCITGIILSSGANAFENNQKIYYNQASIGESYKKQLSSFELLKRQLISAETNILSSNAVEYEDMHAIQIYKTKLSDVEETYNQLKSSSNFKIGEEIVKEIIQSSECKKVEHKLPLPTHIQYECGNRNPTLESFFASINDKGIQVNSYKSGHLEGLRVSVERLFHHLRKYDRRAIGVGRKSYRI